MAGEAEEATQAATGALGQFWKQTFKFYGDGKLGRNFKLAGACAALGGIAALSGGTALAATMPFTTALGGTATMAGTAQGFLPAAGSVAGEFFSHAANGIYITGSYGYDVVTGADWSTFGTNANEALGALTPEAA